MRKIKYILFNAVLLLNSSVYVFGQSIQIKLHELLCSTVTLKEWNVRDTSLLQTFYKAQSETLFWQKPLPLAARQPLLQLLKQSDTYGLNKTDYHYDELIEVIGEQQPRTTIDSIRADIVFTDALLHFLCDVRYGHTPQMNYNGLKSVLDKQELVNMLSELVSATDKAIFVATLEPQSKQYKSLKTLLAHFSVNVNKSAFKDDSIVLNKVEVANAPLVVKLAQLGVLDTTRTFTNKELLVALKEAQRRMDLLPDGRLSSYTLKALNVPLKIRYEAIKATLNDLRWLQRFLNDSIAVVNIPSATLYVYGKGQLIHESRLVVGKKSTPTPTLASNIQEVILYPYWNVPYSIATKELLPRIKQDKGFLTANNFQVLNKQGVVVNPDSINWKQFGPTNFPYLIRQSTGCDNSLGLVKFNFTNPFSVYLHDTPSKGLFSLKKRYFSHGCMRVEKPIELAELLLHEDKATVKRLTYQCLKNQKPTAFSVKSPLPIVVLYNTAWYDTSGKVSFYDDVYGK